MPGVTTEGNKEILSITVGANESSKLWRGMLSDLKKFSSDFKAVYNAPNEKAALDALADILEKWGRKYHYAVSNWENNWEDVSSFFQFPDEVRRIMSEKMLYLASLNVVKKWIQRSR